MKPLLFAGLILILGTSCSKKFRQSSSSTEPTALGRETVGVVTWNLQWFPGKKQSSTPEAATAHIEEVKKALVKMKPDILVLQEVSGEALGDEDFKERLQALNEKLEVCIAA